MESLRSSVRLDQDAPRSVGLPASPQAPLGVPSTAELDASVALKLGVPTHDVAESVALLDGGGQAFPRMLLAIAGAQRTVYLEMYAFSPTGVGARFIDELGRATARGVQVQVSIDGWGSARRGRGVAAALHQAGCTVQIYNRLRSVLVGRIGRNHRKVLLVDDQIAFLGGINIGDEYADDAMRPGWADLALEIRGPQCAVLARTIRREPQRPIASSLRILLTGLGGGWRLRRRYMAAFAGAQQRIDLAHGYFMPDAGIVRALIGAARRGVAVRLLLAGRSDVLFARIASRSLYRRLLAAGVVIHEWRASVLHAKVATVDGARLLVGSFNLDPFSLVNLEALVEVEDPQLVAQVNAWIRDHVGDLPAITLASTSSPWHRWILDPLGQLVARLVEALSRRISRRRRRRRRR